MANNSNKNSKDLTERSGSSPSTGFRRFAALVGLLLIASMIAACGNDSDNAGAQPQPATAPTAPAPAPGSGNAAAPQNGAKPLPELHTMEVAKAVMVTVELDFGPKVPTIAEAITQVERRYAPDDGRDRTFAVLDAYGEPTPDGKLHMSMHVSSEKPGMGYLIFRRTGEVLWQGKILPTSNPPPAVKNLGIIIDNGAGTAYSVDGSNNPASIFDAMVKGPNVTVREFWPDGAEREVTFIYSACGCPVKVMVRRVGNKTVRTKELPVMFPDDPDAVRVIKGLMGWN